MTGERGRITYVSLDVILDNLTNCICGDIPDSEKFRAEVKYWLERLMDYLGARR